MPVPEHLHSAAAVQTAAAYDEVPYESGAFAFTHPARMGAIARLRGLIPAEARRCRYLEIGCALGQNLIPLALQYPEATFVGIDISPRQIDRARRTSEALGLHNLHWFETDVARLERDVDGCFDYIVCHGVLSWVAPETREAIFGQCHRLLTPHGIALMSFNALPGGQVLSSVRRLAQLVSAGSSNLLGRVQAARAAFRSLLETSRECALGSRMREALKIFVEGEDAYLVHEYFSAFNEALTVEAFISACERHALQMVSSASLAECGWRENLQHVSGLSSLRLATGQAEAAVDLLADTTFRCVLVCRGEHCLAPTWNVEALSEMAISVENGAAVDEVPSRIPTLRVSKDGHETQLMLPAAVAAMRRAFSAIPAYVPVAELAADLSPPERTIVLQTLLKLALAGVLDVATTALPIASALPERPRLWPWAAHCREVESRWFCGRRHESLRMDEDMRQLLGLIDGRRTVTELRQGWNTHSVQQQGRDPGERRAERPAGEGRASSGSFDDLLRRLHYEGALA